MSSQSSCDRLSNNFLDSLQCLNKFPATARFLCRNVFFDRALHQDERLLLMVLSPSQTKITQGLPQL